MALTKIKGAGINISATEKLYFDGGGNTYIHESAADVLKLVVGGVAFMDATEGTNAIVFNEGSVDMDFRVESNGNANMLVVDGGNDRVGIGTAAPAKLVHISGATDNGLLEGLQIDNTDHATGETGQAVAINMRLAQASTMRDAGRITVGKDDDWDDAAATDSHMTFKTMKNNTLSEQVKIDADGDLITKRIHPVADGTHDLGDNTLSWRKVYTDNILFNGDSADANALDDYEEGTWTPRGVDATAAAVAFANYTKIGRMVYVSCDVTLGSESGGADQQISGLPFTSAGSGAEYGGVVYSSTNDTASNDGTNPTFQLMAAVRPSETTFRLYFNVSGTTDELSQTQSSGKRFKISIFYNV